MPGQSPRSHSPSVSDFAAGVHHGCRGVVGRNIALGGGNGGEMADVAESDEGLVAGHKIQLGEAHA